MSGSEASVQAKPEAPPAPPPPQRRPRVREVSSRFMTPSASSHSSSPFPNQRQRSSSVQRQRASSSAPSSPAYPDENRNLSNRVSPQRKLNPPRAVAKLVFKESSRPDTPTVPASVSSSTRPRPLIAGSAASKLLQSSGLSPSVPVPGSDGGDGGHLVRSGSARSLLDLRSSMPEGEINANANKTTTGIVVSSRYLANFNGGVSDSPCSRSLDLQRSSSDSSSLFHSLKVSERERERRTNAVKVSGSSLPLPPPPPQVKLTASSCSLDGVKKVKKGSGHQEDVHSLKLLFNRCLQWRLVNAKAEASAQSQKRGAERALYSHGIKIAELYESVIKKRIELLRLQKMATLLNVLDIQMPYLDEWSTFEEDYATSLSETIQALLNASIRIPITGNVRVDVKEVQDALNSAMKLMESIALHISNFFLKAEQNEVLLSELARLTGGERALIEECGYLLSAAYKSEVEECSLRSQLVQLHRGMRQHVQ